MAQGKRRAKLRCEECVRAARAIRLNGDRDHILRYKKAFCEACGFVAKHPCQLDVDHVDGNRENSDPANFRTLCSNCHRLKTHVNGDHLSWLEPVVGEDVQPRLF